VDATLDRAKRKLREYAHRREAKVAAGGVLIGALLGELSSGKIRQDLGFKGTRETALTEQMAKRIGTLAERHGPSLMTGAALLTGRTDALAGTLGVTVGLAAAEIHRDAPPFKLRTLTGKLPEKKPLLERAWEAQRIDYPETLPTEEKFQLLGDLINRLAVEGSYDPAVRQVADEACQLVDGSIRSYAEAVGNWVVQNTKYVLDEEMPYVGEQGIEKEHDAVEIFQEAGQTLASGIRDCDCAVILVAAMLRTQGIWSYARMISQDLPAADFTHIYNVVPLYDEQGEPEFVVDTTPVRTPFGYVQKPIGWEPERLASTTVLFQPLPNRRT
jgi:hypothetical protein